MIFHTILLNVYIFMFQINTSATTPSSVASPTKSQKGSFKKTTVINNNNYAKPKDFTSYQPQVQHIVFIFIEQEKKPITEEGN